MEKIYLDQERYYKPINDICTKYRIPYVYDWTMSLHTNMNYLIKLMNGMAIEFGLLEKMIEEFIRMFEADIQQTVIDILSEWKDNGELGEIVEKALLNFEEKLEDKADKEDLQSFRDLADLNIDNFIYSNNENEKSECYLIKIPKNYRIMYDVTDKENPKDNLMTGVEFNNKKKASIVINASQGGKLGFRSYNVANGIIYQDSVDSGFNHIRPLGINDKNDFKTIKPEDNIYNVVKEGYETVISGFEPLIENGKNLKPIHNGIKEKHPRQVIGKETNGNIFILSVKGRTVNDVGVNGEDIQKILNSRMNVDYAYMLDGGGSTQTYVYGVNIMDNIDGENTEIRKRPDFIYFVNEQFEKKDQFEKNKQKVLEIMNSKIQEAWGYVEQDKTRSSLHLKTDGSKATGIGREKNGKMVNKLNLNDDGISLYNYTSGNNDFSINDGKISLKSKKVNTIFEAPLWKESGSANDIEAGFIYCSNAVKNLPDASAWWVFAVKQSEGSTYYVAQIAIPLGKGRKIMFRNKEGSNWSEWS